MDASFDTERLGYYVDNIKDCIVMMASDDRLDDRIAQRLDDLRGKALEPTRAIEKEMAKWRRGFNMKLESKRVPMLGRMIILETCPRDLTLKAFGLNVSGWPTAVRGTGEYEQEYVKTPRKGTKRWKSLMEAVDRLFEYTKKQWKLHCTEELDKLQPAWELAAAAAPPEKELWMRAVREVVGETISELDDAIRHVAGRHYNRTMEELLEEPNYCDQLDDLYEYAMASRTYFCQSVCDAVPEWCARALAAYPTN